MTCIQTDQDAEHTLEHDSEQYKKYDQAQANLRFFLVIQ
jgi:hypothetical protein